MTKRTKLVGLLIVEVVIIAFDVALREESESFMSWHFVAALVFGAIVLVYAYSIRCPAINCGAQQLIRGWSIFDIRFPGERCYKCGTGLH